MLKSIFATTATKHCYVAAFRLYTFQWLINTHRTDFFLVSFCPGEHSIFATSKNITPFIWKKTC